MKRNPLLASLFNFLIPSMGYLYIGDKKKAFWSYLVLIMLVFSVRMAAADLWILALLVFLAAADWLLTIIDVFFSAEKAKLKRNLKPGKWFHYTGLIAVHMGVVWLLMPDNLNIAANFQLFNVPSPNMEPTLQVGDHVAAKGTKEIERNDIVVFRFPVEPATFYVKRCVGMPGDSLSVTNGNVFVNCEPLNVGPLQYRYFVGCEKTIHSRIFEKYGIKDYMEVRGGYRVFATERSAEELKKLSFITEVKKWLSKENDRDMRCFPDDEVFSWNADFYGPLYIPAKGDRVSLTPEYTALYSEIILKHEGLEDVQMKEGRLFAGNEILEEYTFRQDYYFMLGDNLHNSLDSRYWGFVPEKLIFGKVIYRYWSEDLTTLGRL